MAQVGIYDYEHREVDGSSSLPEEGGMWFASAEEICQQEEGPLLGDTAPAGDDDEPEIIDYSRIDRANLFVLKAAAVACVSSTILGYDIGVMSGALLFMRIDLGLDTVEEECIVSALNLMAVPGALIAGNIADALGRRHTILVSSVIFFVGALCMVMAQNFGMLFFGRVITGIGLGFGLVVGPLYTAELAPANVRGMLVSLGEIFICVGIVLGFLVNLALEGFPPHLAWRLMLSGGMVPAAALFIVVHFMSESPQWLFARGHRDEAQEVLEQSCSSDRQVQERVAEISEALELEKHKSWTALFDPEHDALRHCLCVGCGIAFFQQATGIESVMYYTPHTFKEAGMDGKTGLLAATLAVGVAKLVATAGSSLLLDTVGRRPLLVTSAFGVTGSLVLIAVGSFIRGVAMTIVGQCLFVAFFAIGYGPVCWIIISEVFPLKVRGTAVSIATALNRLTSFGVAMTWLSICKAISTTGCYVLFVGLNVVGCWFCVEYVPETMGLSLEEITTAMLSKRSLTATTATVAGPGMDPQVESSDDDDVETERNRIVAEDALQLPRGAANGT